MSKGLVAVAMSGGVDSSVAAALLKEQGYDVVGLTMKLWACKDLDKEIQTGKARADMCCSPKDILDAKAVCHRLGIPHYVLEMTERFEQLVIEPFIDTYLAGLTPNPCVWCNERVKSKDLMQRAKDLGAIGMATGHYARIEKNAAGDRYLLRAALDNSKDQTYFMFPLTQDELAYLRFPLGEVTNKAEVRRIAREIGLVTAEKHESYEICFVKSGNHRDFLKRHAPDAFVAGDIVSTDGKKLGTHDGAVGYTIGQRRGIGGGGGTTDPLYVVDVDVINNRVVVGKEEELLYTELFAESMYWISYATPPGEFRCKARIRHRGTPQPCTVYALEEGAGPGTAILVVFDEPQRAVAPGQACVLYDDDIVVGGGWIRQVRKPGANVPPPARLVRPVATQPFTV
ncbi:MAG TPA: tRNA 2-thiouridine(34) synthase MnmA [Planctomycetota bacterium]|nr:tRNA 2-thiouridine(34) synthase MnmA [Planctomycetota bacterium]